MEITNMQDQAYNPITATQGVIASSLAGLDWYGNVVNVHIDEETGTVIPDEKVFTRDDFFRALQMVSVPNEVSVDS